MPRCDHAVYRVADLDRSVAFYERLLPARLVSRKQSEDRWRTEAATLKPEGDDDFSIVLLMPRRVRWLLRLFHTLVPRQTRSIEHLGFACDSREVLDERLAEARALGVRAPQHVTYLAERDAWLLELCDPDGNVVEWTYNLTHD